MKNLLLLVVFLVPMLSFGQLKRKDKKAIEIYAHEMCGCMNELFNTLDPKTLEFIVIMAEQGEKAGEDAIQEFLSNATEAEVATLVESFNRLSTPEFQAEIEECDSKNGLSDELAGSIDSSIGDGYNYFYNYLNKDDSCALLKFFLDAATEDENDVEE
jgi:hypothetical protein